MFSLLVFFLVLGAATSNRLQADLTCSNHDNMPGDQEYLEMFQRLGGYGEHSLDEKIGHTLCRFIFIESGCDKLMHWRRLDAGEYIPMEPSNKAFIQKLEPVMR